MCVFREGIKQYHDSPNYECIYCYTYLYTVCKLDFFFKFQWSTSANLILTFNGLQVITFTRAIVSDLVAPARDRVIVRDSQTQRTAPDGALRYFPSTVGGHTVHCLAFYSGDLASRTAGKALSIGPKLEKDNQVNTRTLFV